MDTPELITKAAGAFDIVAGWLLLIIPAGVGLYLALIATQKALTDDQSVIAEKNRLMKNTLTAGAIATGIAGLGKIVMNYFIN